MTVSNYTKGPWETRPGKTGDIKIFMVGAKASGGAIATVRVPCGMEATAKRNAALIAAAPDFADACRDLVDFLDKNPPMGESIWAIQRIRAALGAIQ